MQRRSIRFGLSALALCASAVAAAQTNLDAGKLEYDSSCASCHGLGGKGDGPVARHLSSRPSDLTTIAQRNGGAFPTQLVWEMIDGRTTKSVGAHGTRDMPVWGNVYRSQAIRLQRGAPEWEAAQPPEWYVRGRIIALIDYLARIQAKPAR